MSTMKGIKLLPPIVKTHESLALYKKVALIKSKVGQLNTELYHSVINNEILQTLILTESLQSTRIEGTQVTFDDMIEQASNERKSKKVTEVENYRIALAQGIELIHNGDPITSRMIKQLHHTLMSGDARGTTSSSGEYRTGQNFIGPDNNIEHAVYIPIEAPKIPDYMTNLEYYINGENHFSFSTEELLDDEVILDWQSDPLIKTAVIHAQFESIHPFWDGNGRLGRILIVLCYMMDKLIDRPIFFVSRELERERMRYYNRLNGVRGENPKWFAWIDFFLDATDRMAENLLTKLRKSNDLAESGLKLLESSQGSIKNVWLYTFSNPMCKVNDVSETLSLSKSTVRSHLNTLVEMTLLEVDQTKKRNRVYINYDLLLILE